MKKIAFGVGIIGIITLCIILINAQGPPVVPPFFDGSVIVDGEVPDKDGLSVTAYVDGEQRGSATIYTSGSDVRYYVEVSGTESDEGKTILFYVDSTNPSFSGYAPQNSTWESMKTELLNLIVGTPPAGCSIGADCSDCTGWVSITDINGITQQVRDSDGDNKYDQACCDNIVDKITVYYS